MGQNFWMPSIKIRKLRPNTTALDRPLKIIARHTVVSGNGSYVPCRQNLGRDFTSRMRKNCETSYVPISGKSFIQKRERPRQKDDPWAGTQHECIRSADRSAEINCSWVPGPHIGQ